MAEFTFNTIIESKDILSGQVLAQVEATFNELKKIIDDGYNYLNSVIPQERQELLNYRAQKSHCQNMLIIVDARINELESQKRSLQSMMSSAEVKDKSSIAREIANINRQLMELKKEKARLTNNIRIYTEVIKLQEEYLKMLENASKFYHNAFEDYRQCKSFVDNRNKELIKQLEEVIQIVTSYFSAPQSLGVYYQCNDYLKIDNSILKDCAKSASKKASSLEKNAQGLIKVDNSIYAQQDNVFDSVHDACMDQVKSVSYAIEYLNSTTEIALAMYEYLENYDAYAKKEISKPNYHKNGFHTSSDTAIIEGVGILAWLLAGILHI